jgi:predicted outer membrane repeat protein
MIFLLLPLLSVSWAAMTSASLDVFVDPLTGSDLNSGLNASTPLRSLNGTVAVLAANQLPGHTRVQTIYLNASALYTGDANCHVLFDAQLTLASIALVGYDAAQNTTKATFSCGNLTFSKNEPFVHFFNNFVQTSLTNIAYVNTTIDANAATSGTCGSTRLSRFSLCTACVLCVFSPMTGPFNGAAIVLDRIDVVSVSMNRSLLTDQEFNAPSNAHILALSGPKLTYTSTPHEVQVRNLRAYNNTVMVNPCMPTSLSNATMNQWSIVSGAVLAVSGVVAIERSLITDNSLTVPVSSVSVPSVICVWTGGAAIYVLDALAGASGALVRSSTIARNSVAAVTSCAGAAVVIAASDHAREPVVLDVLLMSNGSVVDGNSAACGDLALGGAISSGFRAAVIDAQVNGLVGITAPVAHHLLLNDSAIVNSVVQSPSNSGGGAIYASSKVSASNVTFSNNTALARKSAGGAVFSTDFDLANCSFLGNFAVQPVVGTRHSNSGGAIATTFALALLDVDLGGCVQNQESRQSLRDCVFSGNVAGGNGGAMYMSGECATSVFMQNCTFSENGAILGSAYYSVGAGSLHMFNSHFLGNTAKLAGTVFLAEPVVSKFGDCSFSNNRAPVGAALLINSAYEVTIAGSQFLNNEGSSGAVVRLANINDYTIVNNSTFVGNYATASNGGALSLQNSYVLGNASLIDCLFHNNSGGLGGGAYINMATHDCAVRIVGCSFDLNDANYGAGLAVVASRVTVSGLTSFSLNFAYASGGGVLVDKMSSVQFSDCNFRDNLANNDGGSITVIGVSAISVNQSSFTVDDAGRGGSIAISEHSAASFLRCTFDTNVATNGGSVFVSDSSTVQMSSCDVFSSIVLGAFPSDLVHSEDTRAHGGGFMSLETNAIGVVENVTVSESYAQVGVGGAFRCAACNLSLTNVDIELCSTRLSRGGGAIYAQILDHNSVALVNVTIASSYILTEMAVLDDETSRLDGFSMGGAILFEYAGNHSGNAPHLSFDGVRLTNNSADLGGALYLDAPQISFSAVDCVVSNNNATLVGGGVYVTNTSLPSGFLNNVTGNAALCFGANVGSTPARLVPTRALPTVAMRGVSISLTLEARDQFGEAIACAARSGARSVQISVLANSTCRLPTASLCTVADADAMCRGSLAIDAPIGSVCPLRVELHSSDALSPVVASLDFNVSIVECAPGFGVDERGMCHECPSGTYNLVAGGSCDACPRSAVCHGANVSAAAGFYLHLDDGHIFGYACEPGACLAAPLGETNDCAADRTGLLCASCANSSSAHYLAPTSLRKDGTMCVDCDEPTIWLLAVFALGGVAICLYLHQSVQGSSSRLKILFYFTQSASQVLPRAAVNEFFSALSLRANRGSPVLFDFCVLPLRPLEMQLLQLAIPAGLVVTLLLIFAVQRLWLLTRGPVLIERRQDGDDGDDDNGERDPSELRDDDGEAIGTTESLASASASSGLNNVGLTVRSNEELPAARQRAVPPVSDIVSTVLKPGMTMGDSSFFSTDRLVRTLIFFALLSYTTMLQTTLSVLWCMDVGGQSLMVTEPSETCSGDRYERARDAVLFGLLPLVAVMPVALAVLLFVWNSKNRLIVSRSAERVADIDVRYGVLYENYRHPAYLWEAVNLLRRLAMALFTIFLSGTPIHSLAMTLLCFAILGLTVSVRPFVNNLENRLECFSLGTLVVFGIVAQAVDANALPDTFLSYLGTVALLVASCLVLSVLARPRLWLRLRMVWDSKVRGKSPLASINRR